MTFNYTKARATAERLIANFGQAGAVRRTAAGDGPAHDPGVGTVTDHTATLVILEYTDRERDGTLIRAGDKRALVSTSGLSITPGLADRLVIGGSSHEIVNIKPLDPGGTVILWDMQVRS